MIVVITLSSFLIIYRYTENNSLQWNELWYTGISVKYNQIKGLMGEVF